MRGYSFALPQKHTNSKVNNFLYIGPLGFASEDVHVHVQDTSGYTRVCTRGSVLRGFTLVELLVVISIIALLLSILMPSLQMARQQAQGVRCLSNLRQLGIAAMMYHNDNNQKLVPIYVYRNGGNRWTWRFFVFSYLSQSEKKMAVYHCPSDFSVYKENPTDYPICVRPKSYGINLSIGLHDYGTPGPSQPAGKYSDIKRPSDTIFMGDIGLPPNPIIAPEYWKVDLGQTSFGYMRLPDDPFFWVKVDPWNIFPRHSKMSNVLFYDGSVGKVSVSKIIDDYNR